MQTIQTSDELDQLIEQQAGLVVLFGGQQCGVCQVIKPKLEQQLELQYPQMKMVYIDCQVLTEVCAQKSVFSLPVVQVYFDGQKFVEKARAFSLAGLMNEIARPYQMLFSE